MKSCGKNVLYLSFNVFRTLVLIEDTIFKSPTGDGTAILRGHPSYAKGFFFQSEGCTFTSHYFKTLSIDPVPKI